MILKLISKKQDQWWLLASTAVFYTRFVYSRHSIVINCFLVERCFNYFLADQRNRDDHFLHLFQSIIIFNQIKSTHSMRLVKNSTCCDQTNTKQFSSKRFESNFFNRTDCKSKIWLIIFINPFVNRTISLSTHILQISCMSHTLTKHVSIIIWMDKKKRKKKICREDQRMILSSNVWTRTNSWIRIDCRCPGTRHRCCFKALPPAVSITDHRLSMQRPTLPLIRVYCRWTVAPFDSPVPCSVARFVQLQDQNPPLTLQIQLILSFTFPFLVSPVVNSAWFGVTTIIAIHRSISHSPVANFLSDALCPPACHLILSFSIINFGATFYLFRLLPSPA